MRLALIMFHLPAIQKNYVRPDYGAARCDQMSLLYDQLRAGIRNDG